MISENKKSNVFLWSWYSTLQLSAGIEAYNRLIEKACQTLGVNCYELVVKNAINRPPLVNEFINEKNIILLDSKKWRRNFGHYLLDNTSVEKGKFSKEFWKFYGWNKSLNKVLNTYRNEKNILVVNLFIELFFISPHILKKFDRVFVLFHFDIAHNFFKNEFLDSKKNPWGIPQKVYKTLLTIMYRNVAKKFFTNVDNTIFCNMPADNKLIKERLLKYYPTGNVNKLKITNLFLPIWGDEINLDVINATRTCSYCLVAVGRFNGKQKGFDFLMDVFQHLPKIFHLDIYGEVTDHGLQQINQVSNVSFKGFVDNDTLKKDILPNYDGLVMTSNFEGCSLALLENAQVGNIAFLRDTFSFANFYTKEIQNSLAVAATSSPQDMAYLIANNYEKNFDALRVNVQKFWKLFPPDHFLKLCQRLFISNLKNDKK